MRFKAHYNIRSYEVDLHGALKPMQLMQLLQESGDRQMREEAVAYDELYNKEHKAFVVSRMSIEVFKPVEKYSDVDVETWIITGKGANFPRGYEMYKGGQLVAKAICNWALVDTVTGKLIASKDYDMGTYSMDEAPELSIPRRFRIPKELKFQEVESSKVAMSMIDINMHMNNTVYASKLYDNIDDAEKYFITSINLRYVHEAPLGSEFKVYRSDAVDPGEMDYRAEKLIYFYTEADGMLNLEAAVGLKKVTI